MKLVKSEHLKILYKTINYFLFGGLIVAAIFIGIIEKSLLNNAGMDDNFLGYLSFSSGFLIVVQFFIIPIAGTIVSGEFDSGTVTFLLIRPATRSKILLAKYVTTILFGVYLIVLYFTASLLIGIVLFGFTDVYDTGRLIDNITINYITGLIEVIMISTLAFAISTIFRNSGLATGLSILLAVSGKMLIQLLSHFEIESGKYLVFANTDLGQYFGSRPMFDGMSLRFSLILLVLYLILYLGITWSVFLRRDVSV